MTEKKPTTHVLMVVDRSGSMQDLAEDVRGGFNKYLDDLRADKGRYRFTVLLFDHHFYWLCDNAPIKDVPKLNANNYQPRGWTALLDAIGKIIDQFENGSAVGPAPDLGKKDRVLLVVQTDGFENSSHEYKLHQIREMITTREAGGQWACIFLGAGPDSWQQAGSMGFQRAQTVGTYATSGGTRSTYSGVTGATMSYAQGATAQAAAEIIEQEVEAGKKEETERKDETT